MDNVKLGDIFEYMPKSKIKAGEGKKQGKYKFFTSSNLQDKYIDEWIYDGEYLIFGTGGKASINYCNEKFSTSTDNFVVKVKKEINAKLIYLYFKNDMQKLEKGFKGASIKHISKDYINHLTIPIYDLKFQEKIVKQLDKVQEIINLRKKQIEELDELIKAQFVGMFGNLKNNDKNWEYVDEIGDVCIVNPKKSEVGNINNIEVSFIPMQAVSEKGDIDTSEIRFLHDVKSGFSYFIENDVLFAKITPCMENGKGAVAKGLKNNIGFGSTEFHVLRPKEKINSIWLYTLTTLDSFRKEAEMKMTGSAGQKRVPTKFFEDYKIGIPPINLQNKFANFVEQINKHKSMLEKSLKETEELQESLMNKYFGE